MGFSTSSTKRLTAQEVNERLKNCNTAEIIIKGLPLGAAYGVFEVNTGHTIMTGKAHENDVSLMNEEGFVSVGTRYRGKVPVSVTIRVRKAGILPFEITAMVTEAGLYITPLIVEDRIYEAPKYTTAVDSV